MAEALPHKAVLVDYDEDLYAPRGFEADLLAQAGIAWAVGQHRTPEAVVDAAHDADVVLIQSVRPLLNREVIARLPRCRGLIRLGIGYDSVDVRTATEHGLPVCNVPTYCVQDVAEHALALLLASVRHLARQDRWIRAGQWDRTGASQTYRVQGRTLGFVAFGRIARTLAGLVQGFGMTLLAYDPYVDAETMARYGVQKVDLDELLRRADFLSVHAPLTERTRHLLSHREFALMKDGVFLVNTSRGPVVDEAALVEALRSGKVRGAGLDVTEQEPLPPDSPLRTLENVTLTPHVGAYSQESVEDLYRIGCRIVVDLVQGIWPEEVVNPEVEGQTRFPFRRR
ncbi:MAG: C-terminal binding protein [Anaerolineae bacterium]